MPAKTIAQSGMQNQTRVLLALSSLGGFESASPVSKGKLTKRLPSEQAEQNDILLNNLKAASAIKIERKGRYDYISLLEQGKTMLIQGLQDTDFAFAGTITSSREVNEALKLMRLVSNVNSVFETKSKASLNKIDSYEEFKQIALDIYDRLNSEYNLGNLVPIYRLRRQISDRVERSQFSKWLFAMQSDNTLQLLEESVEDSAPDKIDDSVTTKLGKLRCYAKRVAA